MKYYKTNYLYNLIKLKKYCVQYTDRKMYAEIEFVLNKFVHNEKGPGRVFYSGNIEYRLHRKMYGTNIDFKSNKEWRKYVKLLVFL